MNSSPHKYTVNDKQALSNDDLINSSAQSLVNAQDSLINSLSIPKKVGEAEDFIKDADPAVIERISFNIGLINSIRFRNCRMLVAAGLPSYAIKEITLLTSLSFEELDSFYRDLSASIGARRCHDWYTGSSSFITELMVDYGEDVLASNFRLFAATCIECALVDQDYELAELIADSSDFKPPYDQRILEWICIAYWLAPNRSLDAIAWANTAIMHGCRSQVAYIVKCRANLQMGEFDEAVSCLDEAERFFFSIGAKDAYAAILQERSALMDQENIS